MTAVYGKELSAYFKNPQGYLCLAVYYLLGGQFFLMQLRYVGTDDISGIFTNMYMVAALTLPLLTMRLFAEEKRQHTDQVLFTAPVSLGEIVWGKFLAAFTLYMFVIMVCAFYFALVNTFSAVAPLWNLFFGNFLGLILLGAALVSIGLLVSALTESQVLAAVGTFGCMLFLMLLNGIGGVLPSALSFLERPLLALSFSGRYADFTAGILKAENVLFFVSVVLVCNFLTVRVLDKGRWMTDKRVKNAGLSVLVTAAFLGYYCRPLSVLWEEKDNRSAVYLIGTGENCTLYPLGEADFDPAEYEKGAYGIAVLGDRLKYVGTEAHRSYVAAFGSAAMFSSSQIMSNNFGNKDFTVGLINTLAGKQNSVSIPSVGFTYEKLQFTKSDYTAVSVLFGTVLPAVVFLAGAVMWLHRRRL